MSSCILVASLTACADGGADPPDGAADGSLGDARQESGSEGAMSEGGGADATTGGGGVDAAPMDLDAVADAEPADGPGADAADAEQPRNVCNPSYDAEVCGTGQSHDECPEFEPEEGTACSDEVRPCYYCPLRPHAADGLPFVYCLDGEWKPSIVYCSP